MRAANLLHANVHGLVLSGVSSPCRRACNADAFAWHFALHSVQPSDVQASCLEHGRPVAVAAFAGALPAGAAAQPGRDCRERMREANAEGKIEGRGTEVRAKSVCTWGWRGTRQGAASCRQLPQRLAGAGNLACFARLGAMALDGATP